MIVVDEGDRLRMVTQSDHARFAAELLSLWRADDLPQHPRRDRLLFAVREHDNGWREADAAPMVDPNRQRPFDFTTYPAAARAEVWRRGITRHADSRPYTALLITRHAEAVRRVGEAMLERLLAELEPSRSEWLAKVRLDAASLEEDYRWLQLADSLSLTVCTGNGSWSEALPLRSQLDGRVLHLEPFPLAGSTTFRIPVRFVTNRAWERDRELGGALARARWTELTVQVAPW